MLRLAALLAATALPARAALAPSPSATMDALRAESVREALAAAPEAAASAPAKTFDGSGSPLPVTVEVLQPLEVVPVPGSGGALQPAPGKPQDGTPAAGGSYHFEGRRTAIPNLTIYTPVKDAPGRDASTRAPSGSSWGKYLMPGLAVAGAAATAGGFFFPPLWFLGGLLLGAWAAVHLLSAKS